MHACVRNWDAPVKTRAYQLFITWQNDVHNQSELFLTPTQKKTISNCATVNP